VAIINWGQDLAKRSVEKKAPKVFSFKQAEEPKAIPANFVEDKGAGSNPTTVGQNKIPISR
jgi:hypothetical protein